MLDVIIVGAGIAGLSAAVSLRRAGHRVRVLERSALKNELGAAINVPPNAARVLEAWEFDPVAMRLVTVRGISLAEGTSRRELNFTPMGDWVRAKYGKPFYFSHRVDLHEALRAMAVRPDGIGMPAEICLGQEVVSYNPDTPSVTLATGEVVKGDVVIAADGVHSIAVGHVLGQENPPQPQKLYNGCFRFLIPAHEIEADPATKWWLDGSDGVMRMFMNGKEGNRLVTYPCRNNEVHNFVGMFHSEDMSKATKEDWLAPVDKLSLLKAFEDFHPAIVAVLNKATEIKQWPLLYRAPISTWRKGRLVLAGDAAHPMLPHQGQGGAQGIEDGVVLGLALCGATTRKEVEQRLEVYEKVRRNRASAIQVLSNAGQDQVEMIHEEAAKYIHNVPKNPQEFSQFNWGHDIVRETLKHLGELDPSFQLPDGFFEGDPYLPETLPAQQANGTNGAVC